MQRSNIGRSAGCEGCSVAAGLEHLAGGLGRFSGLRKPDGDCRAETHPPGFAGALEPEEPAPRVASDLQVETAAVAIAAVPLEALHGERGELVE